MKTFYSSVVEDYVTVRSLLSTNAKLAKNNPWGARVVGVPLAPARQSGRNLCAHSSPGCVSACTGWETGRKVMEGVRDAAVRRALLFLDNPRAFCDLLSIELSAERVKAHSLGEILLARPNESSDVPWENFPYFPWHAADGWYDYCANAARVVRSLSWRLDYHLTFSVKENTPLERIERVLGEGGNIAVVIDMHYVGSTKQYAELPARVVIGGKEYPVVDGDVHDIRRRELDGRGSVVMLRLKGHNAAKSKARGLGFAKRLDWVGNIQGAPTIRHDVCATLAL